MFAEAYKKTTKFTRPVIISTRTLGGDVKCGCGAFILINDEGWVLTVAHILSSFFTFQDSKNKLDKYHKEITEIEANEILTSKQKRKKRNKLERDDNWITNHSFWWGDDKVKIDKLHFFSEGDIAVGKIENFLAPKDFNYPKFKNPKNLTIGTFVCKLGYPFSNIQATFDETKGFILADNTLPLPFFPIEGMYTRNVNINSETNKTKFKIQFIETSTPGLRGQSGGPIFDKDGDIWGIQSRTQHFPLDFSPKIKRDGKEVEENQFLNVGWGVHPNLIFDFLNEHKIKFEVAD